MAGRSSAPNRGRSLRSGGSSAARSSSDVDTIRIGPTASLCWVDRAWGSHFIQSQWARFCSEASTAISRFSGDWNAAALQIIARASERASSSGPHTSMRSKARRSIDAGRFGQQPVHDQQPVQRRGGGRVDLVDDGASREPPA